MRQIPRFGSVPRGPTRRAPGFYKVVRWAVSRGCGCVTTSVSTEVQPQSDVCDAKIKYVLRTAKYSRTEYCTIMLMHAYRVSDRAQQLSVELSCVTNKTHAHTNEHGAAAQTSDSFRLITYSHGAALIVIVRADSPLQGRKWRRRQWRLLDSPGTSPEPRELAVACVGGSTRPRDHIRWRNTARR